MSRKSGDRFSDKDMRQSMLSVQNLDVFYGDGTDVGHFSPIGAYDPARDLVLMLDVYKKDYEPMWAPLPRLAKAMATASRETGEPRGYAVVQRPYRMDEVVRAVKQALMRRFS